MKGHVKITIAGEEVTLRFATGVYEDYQEYCDANGVSAADARQFKHLRVMFALMEFYGTEDKWKDPDIVQKAVKDSFKYKNMGFDEMEAVMALMDEIEGNEKAVGEKKK